MEHNEGDNEKNPLIPNQQPQGKTIQTILITKWTETIEMLILSPFLIRYKEMHERFLLIIRIELHTFY